jgi:energy-coupling factor transporter ATP-binding protein EcfA2
MVKLQWLQINRFRSVKPGTRLTFDPGYNVLLGQNGTGKTTLLNLVAAVVSSNFLDFRGTDFDLKYCLASEKSTATISARNEPKPSGAPHALEMRGLSGSHERGVLALDMKRTEPLLIAEVRLVSKAYGAVTIDTHGSKGTISVMDGQTMGPSTPFEVDADFDLVTMIQAALLTVGHDILFEFLDLFLLWPMQRFDESLDYFAKLSDSTIRLLSAPNEVRAISEGQAPLQLEDVLAVLAKEKWGLDRYVIPHDRLPFLQETVRLLDFASAEITIDLQESNQQASSYAAWMKMGNIGFFFTHHGGWKISAKLLSYGQKRMLAFLYYLATVQSVAVADELVNGLHHRWIQAAIAALGLRQIFLTSQNPLLLDYLTFENPEQVRSTFILCRWEGEGTQAWMVWENMTQEAAEDFFDSYKVGFQQVGELLQAKGLW